MTRDFLKADPASAGSLSRSELESLSILKQTDYLAEIALYLRRQNADVLCSAVVKGTSQLSNSITDLNSHEVVFEVGGKPVQIFSLLAYSTYNQTISLSILSSANINDGIPFVNGSVLVLPTAVNSVYIRAAALSGNNLIVNGPANVTDGGFFLYGFTISDFIHKR